MSVYLTWLGNQRWSAGQDRDGRARIPDRHEATVAGYLNTLQAAIDRGAGANRDLSSAYAAEVAQADDANALIGRLDLLLTGGRNVSRAQEPDPLGLEQRRSSRQGGRHRQFGLRSQIVTGVVTAPAYTNAALKRVETKTLALRLQTVA